MNDSCFIHFFIITSIKPKLSTYTQTHINHLNSGGSYGTGYRFKLKHTRAIVDAIHSGELGNAEYETMPVFNLRVPKQVSGVPDDVLLPSNTWPDEEGYNSTLKQLAQLFVDNFKKFEDGGGILTADQAHAILAAGPKP